MDLDDFVKHSLLQIVSGVAAAREEVKKHGGDVGTIATFGDTKGMRVDEKDREIQLVQFDIALTDGTTTETKGGIGVLLGAIALGSQGASKGELSAVSRIKFTVPLVLP